MPDAFQSQPVVGRFAPSPTGLLHFGTLLAALGSYLLARSARGRWQVRIEDLDGPRVVPGAADRILRQLELCGLEWDGEILYQSRRADRYRQVLEALRGHGLVFDCTCSRREILASAPHPGEDGPIYPGTCRNGPRGQRTTAAVRIRVPAVRIRFVDGVRGVQLQQLDTEVGDFVLYRADGQFAYQLAVVVDDMDTGVNQVVRGADLLSSTARQIYLYQCLNASPPVYAHLPVALGPDLRKLSKRYGQHLVVTEGNAGSFLRQALEMLGQDPPQTLNGASAGEVISWARTHFAADRIPAADIPTAFFDDQGYSGRATSANVF